MPRLLVVVVAALGLAAASDSPSQADRTATFHLHLLGHDIGREVDTFSHEKGRQRLESTFHFDDRGAAVDLTARLELGADGSALGLVVRGKTYRYFSADTEVTVQDGRAHVRDGPKTDDISLAGKPFFPLDGYAPIGVQEQLIRYWLAHGRPKEIVSPPAGVVRIAARGLTTSDSFGRGGEPVENGGGSRSTAPSGAPRPHGSIRGPTS